MGRLEVVISDVHLDYTLPMHPAYLVVKKFCKEVKPYGITILGDFWDAAPFCPHTKRKPLLREMKRYFNDRDMIREEIAEIDSYCQELRYCKGNHEDWLDQYIEAHPEWEGLSFAEDFGLNALGVEFADVNEVISVGSMNFTHGWYENKYHARKHLDQMGANIFYGHTHSHQKEMRIMRALKLPHMAMSLGCLCDKNPHYMRNRPNQWVHGFGIFERWGDGLFTPLFIPIIEGRFSYAGEVWT